MSFEVGWSWAGHEHLCTPGARPQPATVSCCFQQHLGSIHTSAATQVNVLPPPEQREASHGRPCLGWVLQESRNHWDSWPLPFPVPCAYYCCC